MASTIPARTIDSDPSTPPGGRTPMTAALLTPQATLRCRSPIVHGWTRDAQSPETTTMGGAEVLRWVLWLGIPFAASAAFLRRRSAPVPCCRWAWRGAWDLS